MANQNTIYIAEPIFSEKLLKYDLEISFPPIKKIGITTNHPDRREKELLGTLSPIKISIVKAWTEIDAKKVETMLHTLLDNMRLDGEFFWDGNETLVDAVTDFINSYHPEAKEIKISDDKDVKAAFEAFDIRDSQKINSEVIPILDNLKIEHKITKSEKGVRFQLGDYRLHIGAKTGGKYTLTIFSKNKSTEEALKDFIGSQELSALGSEDSPRRARIPMSSLDDITNSLSNYKNTKL